MSWPHCFWGVGCSVSPYIMNYALTGHSSWGLGFRIVSILQIVLTAALFFSLPLWKKTAGPTPRTVGTDAAASSGAAADDAPAGSSVMTPFREDA